MEMNRKKAGMHLYVLMLNGGLKRPRVFQVDTGWVLTCEGHAIMGPCWKELFSVYFRANPEKLPKNA